MSEYKVGDRVRITSDEVYRRKGSLDYVSQVLLYGVYTQNAAYFYGNDEVELYVESESDMVSMTLDGETFQVDRKHRDAILLIVAKIRGDV